MDVRKILLISLMFFGMRLNAQQVDSIFFHLYTDSLKKGTHNYINVDGKLSNGRWMPMTAKEVQFSSSSCTFSGNELVIPDNCREEKIQIKAVLKSNPAIFIERSVWIKKLPDPELPPFNDPVKNSRRNKKKN